jgi:hypothetical protein
MYIILKNKGRISLMAQQGAEKNDFALLKSLKAHLIWAIQLPIPLPSQHGIAF